MQQLIAGQEPSEPRAGVALRQEPRPIEDGVDLVPHDEPYELGGHPLSVGELGTPRRERRDHAIRRFRYRPVGGVDVTSLGEQEGRSGLHRLFVGNSGTVPAAAGECRLPLQESAKGLH